MREAAQAGAVVLLLLSLPRPAGAAAGTDGADFLNIPVGGRPAALGGAYVALADDGYAPVWNPAGLGFLDSTQMASMHLAYLGGISYEFVSLVDPLLPGHSLGASVQYFHTGAIQGTDASGDLTSDFYSYYASYNLAYGQTVCDRLSLGVTAKLITARLDGYSADAGAADVGAFYRASQRLDLAAVYENLGSALTFISQQDELPKGLMVGASYRFLPGQLAVVEGDLPDQQSFDVRFGYEAWLLDTIALRAGYDTASTQELTFPAGLSLGVGLRLWGQSFDFAYLPFGELGTSEYFSLVLNFGAAATRARDMGLDSNGEGSRNELLPQEMDTQGSEPDQP